MITLIPALILLLLHGPSSFERLAENGQLPAAFVALQRDVASASGRTILDREESCRRVLATLIAATGDRELSEAFHAMFTPPSGGSSETPKIFDLETESPPIAWETDFRRPPDGFNPGCRSRDGPVRV
jgi:hypothetical protein